MIQLIFFIYLLVSSVLVFLLFKDDDLDQFYKKYRQQTVDQKTEESELSICNSQSQGIKQSQKLVHSQLINRLKTMKKEQNNRSSFKNISMVYKQLVDNNQQQLVYDLLGRIDQKYRVIVLTDEETEIPDQGRQNMVHLKCKNNNSCYDMIKAIKPHYHIQLDLNNIGKVNRYVQTFIQISDSQVHNDQSVNDQLLVFKDVESMLEYLNKQ